METELQGEGDADKHSRLSGLVEIATLKLRLKQQLSILHCSCALSAVLSADVDQSPAASDCSSLC